MPTKPKAIESKSKSVMTTREAWTWLADQCEDFDKCGCCGKPAIMERCTGLCSAISLMRHRGMIDYDQEKDMLSSLPKGTTFVEGVRGYIWPTTPEGMHRRAEFCRHKAEGKQ